MYQDKNKQQKRKKKNNYFSRNVEQYGEDFLNLINRAQLIEDAPRIIRDIAYGRIDYSEFDKYFMNQDLMIILIDYVQTQLRYYSSSLQCMDYTLQAIVNNVYYIDNYSYNAIVQSRASTLNYTMIYNTINNALSWCMCNRTIEPLLTINTTIKNSLQLVKL